MRYYDRSRSQMVSDFVTFGLMFIVAMTFLILAFTLWNRDIDSAERVQTDRIAACTDTDEVVACLEALK